MRRLLVLLTFPIVALACTAKADAHPPEEQAAVLTVRGATSEDAALRIAGRLENAPVPAVFRLRTDLGCAHDTTLEATAVGSSFSVALGAPELADAFACAIDAEAGDATLPPITVTPGADTTSAAAELRLDPSFFAVVAADLDARSGYLVRFTVLTDGPLSDAHVTLDGVLYGATLAPAGDGTDDATMAIFEVPARAWAEAVIAGTSARVDATLQSGKIASIALQPTASIETEA